MKVKVSAEEWEKIDQEASAAKYFLTHPRFQFIRDYLNDSMESAKDLIVENRIVDSREEITISQRIRRILYKPKDSEINETVGKYKAIKKFLSDMQNFVNNREDLIKQENAKKITIERSYE